MSTPLPTKEQVEQSNSFMVDQIHVPAFLEKLAANGLQPRNEAEQQQLLKLGALLWHRASAGQEKAARDGNPFLTRVLGQLEQPEAQDVDQLIKKSADAFVGQSDLAKTAALVYAHAAAGGEIAP